MRYKAFISYRHNVLPTFVKHFELALKTYAKPLLKPPIRIFRDENHLVPGIDLSVLITEAIDGSEYFILLASPEAAQSPWVEKEVSHWLKEPTRRDAFIVVLLSGSITATSDGTVDWTRTDALPYCLKSHLSGVPLFVDMRWAMSDESLDLAHPEFRRSVNAVVAKMRGVDPNDMLGMEVRQHRWNRMLRNIAVTALAAMALLSTIAFAVALSQRQTAVEQRDEAEKQRGSAVMTTAAAQIEQGRRTDALALTERDAGLPDAFKANVMLSVFDSGAVLDVARDFRPSDPDDEFDVDRLELARNGKSLIAQGWYNGIHIVPLGTDQTLAWCGLRSRFSLFSTGDQGRLIGFQDDDQITWARIQDCAGGDSFAPSFGSVSPLVVLDGSSSLLVGDSRGRLFEISGERARVVRALPSAVEAILPSGDDRLLALLTADSQLRLMAPNGRDAGPALRLTRGTVTRTTSPEWAAYVRSREPRDRAVVVSLPIGGGGSDSLQELAIAFDVDDAGVTSIVLVREGRVLAARVTMHWEANCRAMEWIDSTSWHRMGIDTGCDAGRGWEDMRLPVRALAAAFCGPNFHFVLVGDDNRVRWGGVTGESHVAGGHVEQSWADSANSVACTDDGVAYVGFRVTGIRKYEQHFEIITERLDAARVSTLTASSAGSGPEPQPSDEWNADSDASAVEEYRLQQAVRGGQTVSVDHDTGIIDLTGPAGAVWSRKVADTQPYRTGTWIDRVEEWRVDELRRRLWVLTSFGELLLLDLHTGVILDTLATGLLTAPPATLRALHELRLNDASGDPEFVHTNGNAWWRVRAIRRIGPQTLGRH